jgi:hypothetical protein
VSRDRRTVVGVLQIVAAHGSGVRLAVEQRDQPHRAGREDRPALGHGRIGRKLLAAHGDDLAGGAVEEVGDGDVDGAAHRGLLRRRSGAS